MKKARVFGVIALILALVVLAGGVCGTILRMGMDETKTGWFAEQYQHANEGRKLITSIESNQKAANAAVTKASNAAKKADAAKTAAEALETAAAAYLETGKPDDEQLVALQDALALLDEAMAAEDTACGAVGDAMSVLADASTAFEMGTAIDSTKEVIAGVNTAAAPIILSELRSAAQKAVDASIAADNDIVGVNQALSDIASADAEHRTAWELIMAEAPVLPAWEAVTDYEIPTNAEEITILCGSLKLRADEQAAACETLATAAEKLRADVATTSTDVKLDLKDSVISFVARNRIGVYFTAGVLLLIAFVLMFGFDKFKYNWKNAPLFSTAVALLVIVIAQTYALGFNKATAGEWFGYWLDNVFNVMRANTSVGMIALGMTMVILIGGIDLAVGSTLVGVGAVVMVLIDSSDNGILMKLGITGIPAYAIAIAVGMLVGLLIGTIIGVTSTKGRVPPFIVTLGVMNIVRSVTQYSLQRMSPRVPKGFQAISRTEFFGQQMLPIIYWLVLAVIVHYIVSSTRFGRYLYAIGSNERTTRLSGINVDRIKIKVYAIMGFIVSLAAIMQLARIGTMDASSSGSGYELDAIAAVIVGGTRMSGGKGSVIGTMIGVLIIGVMKNMLTLLGVDPFLTNAFQGAIIVAAVLMQHKEKEL